MTWPADLHQPSDILAFWLLAIGAVALFFVVGEQVVLAWRVVRGWWWEGYRRGRLSDDREPEQWPARRAR